MGWNASDMPDLTGRLAVVTGGNGGLGFATSVALAEHGAGVVVAARNLEKAEAARRRILERAPRARLEVRRLDLGSLQAVETFANDVLLDHPVVDMLFDNAGVMAVAEGATSDGFETQFGTNHLGHFALTMRLLPALLAAPAGRVVATTSAARFMAGTYDLGNPHMRGRYDPWQAYGMSKRANLQFAIELNRRLGGTRATAYVADPGMSRTDLQTTSFRALPGLQQRLWVYADRAVGQSADRGALPQLRAGTDPAAVPGSLYAPRWGWFGAPVRRGVRESMRRPEQLELLWELSERETGCSMPARLDPD